MQISTLLSVLLVVAGIQAETFEGYDDIGSIDDGTCALPFPEANLDLEFINERQPPGGFYLGTLNTKLEAVSIAKAILGRNLTANDDPRDYCPRLDWRTSEDGRVDAGKFIGFGRNATSVTCQKLDPLGNKHTCTIVKGAKFIFRADTYWTLTDQKTYIVIVICAGDGKKFFNVISTKPVLEKDVKDKISAHVEQLGFNPKNFNTVDFSLCY